MAHFTAAMRHVGNARRPMQADRDTIVRLAQASIIMGSGILGASTKRTTKHFLDLAFTNHTFPMETLARANGNRMRLRPRGGQEHRWPAPKPPKKTGRVTKKASRPRRSKSPQQPSPGSGRASRAGSPSVPQGPSRPARKTSTPPRPVRPLADQGSGTSSDAPVPDPFTLPPSSGKSASRKSTPSRVRTPQPSPGSGRSSRRSSPSVGRVSTRSSPAPAPAPAGPVRSGRVTKWQSAAEAGDGALGLHTIGNFCYRLSVLQCLVHLPALYNEIVEANLHPEDACSLEYNECVACAFKRFLRTYWNDVNVVNYPKGRRGVVMEDFDTAILMRALATERPNEPVFSTNGQQDASEFFMFLISAIRETDNELANAIQRIFRIGHVVIKKCPYCDHEPVMPPEFNIGLEVGMDWPKKKSEELSLQKLLEAYHKDVLKDQRCPNVECPRNTQAARDSQLSDGGDDNTVIAPSDVPASDHTKVSTITERPAVLSIRLKRSQWHEAKQRMWKIRNRIDIPEVLDLTKFTGGGKALKYRLYGVVAHEGNTALSGHYIAAVRHRDGAQYCTIDDETRYEPDDDFSQLSDPSTEFASFDSTVLFYLKIEDGDDREEPEADSDASSSSSNSTIDAETLEGVA